MRMMRRRLVALGLLSGFLIPLIGCDSPSPPAAPPSSSAPSDKETSAAPPKSGDSPPPAAPMSETAAPAADPSGGKVTIFKQTEKVPSLEELEKSVEWGDSPIVDYRKHLADYLATKPQKTSAADALKLRNTSAEINAQILDGLGRPPAAEGDLDDTTPFNRHIPADIKSTNPLMQSSVYEGYLLNLTGIGFFSFDWKLEPGAVSDTVVSWQTSKDKLYDKVVMRSDLTWSDGKPITAHDVVFTYEVIMTDDIPIPAVRTGMEKIKWVHAYDDHTFVIAHKESLVTNVWNLNFPVIPKHVYEKTIPEDKTLVSSPAHVKLEDEPVVGGAYRIVKRLKGQEILLERREEYYMQNGKQIREKPRFKTVRLRVLEDRNTALLAFKNGDIEDIELQPNQWVTQTTDDEFYRLGTKVRGTEWTYYYFGWNTKTPFFSDARVRKAMSYAMDYRELLEDLTYGLYEQSVGEFHPTSWMAPATPRTPYKQDLDKAEDLLDEAGWVDNDNDGVREKVIGGKKVKFEFEIMCANDDLRIKTCTILKKNLENIGVRCNVRPTEFTVLQEKAQKHEFEAQFAGWGTGTDPSTTENLWKTGEQRNYTQYSNPEVDKLFDEGRKEFDLEKRKAVYRKIDEILWEEQPYTWLYYRSSFYGFNKRLRGYMFSPRGPYSYSPGVDAFWAVK